MKERKLTGNKMFEMVKEECERSMGSVGNKGKKKGVLYFRGGSWVKYVDKKDLWKYWKYEGEIKNGKPHGDGTWKCGFMFFYVGEFVDGYMSGQGTKYNVEGGWIKYKGGMLGNNEHGKGIKYTSDGEKMIGQFRHGWIHNGMWYDKNGKIKYKVVNGKEIKP